MSVFTETIVETFRVVSCYTCSLRFGIPQELYRRVVTDAVGSVHCPACGNETCWRESEAQKQIKQLEAKLQWECSQSARLMQSRDEIAKVLTATKGIVTKLKKRVGAGTCPCCKRTFKQLAAHMACKHPEFSEPSSK